MAIAGKDFVIVGGDTRLSDGGYGIHTRNSSKIHKLTNQCVIASSGQQSERITLWKTLDIKVKEYLFACHHDISAKSISQVLSTTLYYRRFMPIYTFNVLAGLHEGKGCVWGYDAVGSFELNPYSVTGTGSALITSILDNQIQFKTQSKNFKELTLEETLTLFKDSFICAGERDIYTGDAVEYAIITKDGVQFDRFDLRKD